MIQKQAPQVITFEEVVPFSLMFLFVTKVKMSSYGNCRDQSHQHNDNLNTSATHPHMTRWKVIQFFISYNLAFFFKKFFNIRTCNFLFAFEFTLNEPTFGFALYKFRPIILILLKFNLIILIFLKFNPPLVLFYINSGQLY